MYSITILTPAYNRAATLPRLYESLVNQTDRDFTWLVVDDGSSDRTPALMQGYMRDDEIRIEYFAQENGGKHRALNTGIAQIDTDITFIVDSDDWLVPEAVATIKQDWQVVADNGLAGVSYLRGYDLETVIGQRFPTDYAIDNFNELRSNLGVAGDKAEAYSTSVLKQYPFPSFPGERFMSEGTVWKSIGFKYDMLFINKIIYIGEYLNDGLTKSGRRLLLNNPKGSMLNSKIGLDKSFALKRRLINALLYTAYGFVNRLSPLAIFRDSGNRPIVAACLIPGYFISLIWKLKYRY